MSPINLKAHFDGESIRLDEPFQLPVNAQLIVTVLPDPGNDADRATWAQFSADGLARAYGADEPDYSDADLKP